MVSYSREELQALWLEFQKQEVAACPYCESKVEITLADDPAEDGSSSPATIKASCTGCGREAEGETGNREIYGWSE